MAKLLTNQSRLPNNNDLLLEHNDSEYNINEASQIREEEQLDPQQARLLQMLLQDYLQDYEKEETQMDGNNVGIQKVLIQHRISELQDSQQNSRGRDIQNNDQDENDLTLNKEASSIIEYKFESYDEQPLEQYALSLLKDQPHQIDLQTQQQNKPQLKMKKREKVKNIVKGIANYFNQFVAEQQQNEDEDGHGDQNNKQNYQQQQAAPDDKNAQQADNKEEDNDEQNRKEVREQLAKTYSKLKEYQQKMEDKEKAMSKKEKMNLYFYNLRKKIEKQEKEVKKEQKANSKNYLKQVQEEQQDYEHEAEEIQSDMLNMASSMKQFALGFKQQFRQDEEVLNQIQNSQDKNLQQTEKEREEIVKMQSKTFSSFFQRIIMLVIATVTFFMIGSFIWLFPNKIQTLKPQ
eukprot:403375093